MTASELIATLGKLVATYGDKDVYVGGNLTKQVAYDDWMDNITIE